MTRHMAMAAVLLWTAAAMGQEKVDVKPLLRLEAGGPTSNVTALAFSPDGKILYAAGYDKVVRGWTWNDQTKTFSLDETISYRVPIGPGLDGAISAIAVSDDGQWLAAGGFGVVGGDAMKFTEAGRLVPVKGGLTPSMRADRGQVVVFHTRDRTVKTLRGHTGPILSLTFAHNAGDRPSLLSAAQGWSNEQAKTIGEAKVWDVLAEKELGSRDMPALVFARRPGLELIAQNASVLAFLAWEDGTLTRWQVPTGTAQSTPAPQYNATLDLVRGQNRLVTAGMKGLSGILQAVDFDGKVVAEAALPRPANANEFDLPLVARTLQGGDVAVVVGRMKGRVRDSDSLAIASGTANDFGRILATVPIGSKNQILPTLAVSDKWIALGGFPDHRILVFGVDDVRRGKAAPIVLRSAGATMRSVAFVKKGGDRGIAVGEKAGGDGDTVFDLTAGKLLGDRAGWTSDAAPAGDLRIAIDGLKVALSDKTKTLSTTRIKEGFVTAVAVLPPTAVDIPLVAIASFIPDKGTTLLDIANGTTGEIVRRCAGHTAPIRGLSFRADGKLLASAGDDQTTIVWSLTDLTDVLGKHGTLGDLAVDAKGNDLVVIESAGVDAMPEGAVVRGLYDKSGKLQPLKSPAAFYEAVWLRKPGTSVKLRVARGGQEADVSLPVAQGADVRKPLFSLFFPRDEAGKLGDWLGWNPLGPYDSSRREAERYLGWHFNTGRPEQPASFAFIDQYRKEYFRPGLLKGMAELGDVPPPPRPPAPKPVLLVPGIAEDGVLVDRAAGEHLVRRKSVDLHVTIPAYEPFPGDELTWQLDDQPPRPLEATDVNLWSASLDVPVAGKATRRVVVRMKRTPEGWPAQEHRADLVLRVVAPPPKIRLDAPAAAEAIKVEKPDFAVKVRFAPGADGVPLNASVTHESQGTKVAERDVQAADAETTIELPIQLRPGLNQIRVRAVNSRAVDRGHELEEAATLTLPITYVERKIVPPSIVFESLVPADGGAATPIAGRGVHVDSAKVAVVGRIVAEDPLTRAEWNVDTSAPTKISGLDLKKAGPFRIDLELKPGAQTLRLSAASDGAPAVAAVQEITYRPRLPELVLVSPEAGFTATGSADRGETPIEVRWLPGGESYPVTIEAEVVANGTVVGRDAAKVDLSAGKASIAKLPLAPGANEIRVRMRHAFGGDDRVASVPGRYARPPRIDRLTTTPVEKSPYVDVIAEVASPLQPVADTVAAKVNGSFVRPAKVEVRKGTDEGTWQVVAYQVPLAAERGQEKSSAIALSLATADGEAKASLPEAVKFALPLPPAPEVTLLEPSLRDSTVSEPTAKIRFKVASEAPIARVEVLKGDKVVERWDNIPAAAEPREFSVAAVPLDWGLNSLRLVAWGEGGVKTVPLNINVPPQPVRLELDSVEVAPTGVRVRADVDGNIPPLPVGRVVLHGAVRWNSNDDALLSKAKQVRLFVNGFQQLPVDLKPVAGKPRERKFEVPVVLNFANNDVEIDLPELKQDAANRRRINVGCRQPIRGQHLHVLVIAPQENDEAKLVGQLSHGIKARAIGPGVFKTDVFDVVRFYVLARHVQLLEISSRLDRIADNLRERARAGNPNDLVLIYFQGKETAGSEGPVLWTSEQAPWLQLTLKDLSKNYLSRFSGGQVLILDTITQNTTIDFGDVRFAYLRRPDPRPLVDASRPRLSAQLEKEMPRVIWLDQLTTLLAAQVQPSFQSYLPDPLKNKIQLNPN